jgi:hypothetical protein
MPTRNANPTEFLAWRWIRAMLEKCQVAAFDGRPLYQYKLSHEEVVDLQSLLTESFKRTLPEIPRSLGAAFCLWAAHWFQQEFQGGQWTWSGPAKPVGAPTDHASTRLLTREGLAFLGRKIRRIGNYNEYLASLVVEGGFPTRLISDEKNWLSNYIEAVTIASGEGDLSLEAAVEHAVYFQNKVPPTFRANSLVHLTADLAHHIAGLRRRLADAGVASGAVEWLDSVDPHWREGLPISTNDESARHLVEGLVRVSARKFIMPTSCSRILSRGPQNQWTFGIILEIEGKIEDTDLPSSVRASLTPFNRVRLLPSGWLAKTGLPAAGIADRSDQEGWRGWEVRPS